MAAAAATELTTDQVAEMERLLFDLNFDPGKIDGVVDARTHTAIRLYQEFSALPPDGEPSAKLLGELRQVTQALADMRATSAPAEAEAAKAAEPAATEPAEPAATETPPPAPAEASEQVADKATEPAEPTAADPAESAATETPPPAPAEAPEQVADKATEPAEPTAAEPAGPEVAKPPEPDIAKAPEPKIAERKAAEPAPPAVEPRPTAAAPAAPPPAEAFNLAGMITRLRQQRASEPNSALAPSAAAADVAGRERTLIWRVQQELRRIGLDPGAADGNLRPHTTRAIETYQRARGVAADGRVSTELLALLQAEATPSGPSAPAAAGAAAASAAPGSQVAAIDTAPGNGYAAFKAGFGAAQSGDFDRAVQHYSQSIASGDLALEHLAAALYNRANAYQYLGDTDPAIEDYSAAIANKPGFADAYYNRGFAYDLKGESRRAVEDFRKARDLGLQRLGVRAPDLLPPLL